MPLLLLKTGDNVNIINMYPNLTKNMYQFVPEYIGVYGGYIIIVNRYHENSNKFSFVDHLNQETYTNILNDPACFLSEYPSSLITVLSDTRIKLTKWCWETHSLVLFDEQDAIRLSNRLSRMFGLITK